MLILFSTQWRFIQQPYIEIIGVTPRASGASRLAHLVSISVGPEPRSDTLLVQMY